MTVRLNIKTGDGQLINNIIEAKSSFSEEKIMPGVRILKGNLSCLGIEEVRPLYKVLSSKKVSDKPCVYDVTVEEVV